MSDSISSASQTVASTLTGATNSTMSSVFGNNGNDCFYSNIRFLLWMITLICIICLGLSLLTPMDQDTIIYQQASMRACECNRCRNIEHFSNDVMYSYKTAQMSNFQSVPLTAPDTKQNSPSNLVFGQAMRYITIEDDKTMYSLEIYANLYVLDGNILNITEGKVAQAYKVYLISDQQPDSKQVFIGNLNKDGDGIYKLKFKTPDNPLKNLCSYGQILVVYEIDGKQTVLLQGVFN